jgi:dynein heavy chain 1
MIHTLTCGSFDTDFALVPADPTSNTPALIAPDGLRREASLSWVASLPDSQSPTWLGLPANAETVLLTTFAINLAADMLRLLVSTTDA